MERTYPRPFGSFVLLQFIGRGGMSEIELARQAVTEANFVRFIVIKRIHKQHTGNQQFIRMFQDEARINAELHHENIAQVYAFGRADDEYYLAMEYVPGLDLRMLQMALAEQGRILPIEATLRIMHDVLAALHYAHGHVDTFGRTMNIVHRDVNPRNIMLSMRGEAKLIDFGVAKSDTKSEQTKEHALKGKYAYMAPEQIDGLERLDGRADLFALGLVLHELLTGQRPFAQMNEVQTFHRILSGKIPTPDTVGGRPCPEGVLELHQRALKVDRTQRYASAQEMGKAVQAAAEPLGGLLSSSRMSEILHEIVPGEFQAISDRLKRFGRLDMTGYYRKNGPEVQTLVRATNVTEAFEIKRRPRPGPPSLSDEPATAPIAPLSQSPSPPSTRPPPARTSFQRVLMTGAFLLLALGYLLVMGTSFLIWNLLESNQSHQQHVSDEDD